MAKFKRYIKKRKKYECLGQSKGRERCRWGEAPWLGLPQAEQPLPIRQPNKQDGDSLGLAEKELYAIQSCAAMQRGKSKPGAKKSHG